VVLGHNDDPPRPGMGSAIFLHVAAKDFAPTQGCVAIDQASLRVLLTEVSPGDTLRIGPAASR
jgi:L,D-peptidoglycan transpeptidase YkuD (ErfK/YbiS/YcfS/YnhG family)